MSSKVLFDHFACTEPRKSNIRGSSSTLVVADDKQKSTAVSIKLKGIIQSKKTSSVGGGLNLATVMGSKRSFSKKIIPLVPRRSGKSSCNSTPGKKVESMILPSNILNKR